MRTTRHARDQASLVVAVSGELDIAAAPRLGDALAGIMRRRTPYVVLDLSALTFCDSSGLAALLRAARQAELAGGELVLAAPTQRVAKVLTLTGLDRTLVVHRTLHAALTAPKARPAPAVHQTITLSP